jgi:hypothetical protein
MLMKQVSLSLGKRRMVTWIESDERLIEGAIVSMKGSSDQWRVDAVYTPVIEKKDINRNWHVGGL